MTQILGVVTRKLVFHVSDRLLSQQTALGVQAFDRNSNKAVIFCARDAHVVVAYTGRAYLDNIPTDTFIAQSLLGQPLADRAFMDIGYPTAWTDIGRSVKRLQEELCGALQRTPRAERNANFEVSILGWKQRRTRNKRIAPIIWDLRWQTNDDLRLRRYQRWWAWFRSYVVSITPDPPDASIDQWMRAELREPANESVAGFQRVLIETLHRCSATSPTTIGRACLSIKLNPTGSPRARIRFHADSGRPLDPTPDDVGYSPWIVAPPLAWAPARIRSTSGAHGWDSENYSWIIDGLTPAPGPLRLSQSSQPRPPDPQKPRRPAT